MQSHPSFHHFKSLALQWEEMPTFLICEYTFYLLAIIAFIHAKRNGLLHLTIWLGSLLAGTANDVFFMFLPVVDNFWQAQATIMLTPRLPLYIPCVYICFMYFSTIAAWHLPRMRIIQTAALAGFLALLFYGPYDILGAKFLWWTWHTTDASVQARLLGAPLGSSMWILTFASSFSFLLQLATKKNPDLSFKRAAAALVACCAFTTPLMLLQMTLLSFLDENRIPSLITFFVLVALYLACLILPSIFEKKPIALGTMINRKLDALAAFSLFFYYVILFLIVLLGNAETHNSYGVHQTIGPCTEKGTDINGNIRNLYLCKEQEDPNFRICTPNPADFTSWYTVCGKAYSHYAFWLFGILFYCVAGLMCYFRLFTFPRQRLNE